MPPRASDFSETAERRRRNYRARVDRKRRARGLPAAEPPKPLPPDLDCDEHEHCRRVEVYLGGPALPRCSLDGYYEVILWTAEMK